MNLSVRLLSGGRAPPRLCQGQLGDPVRGARTGQQQQGTGDG